MLVKNFFLFLNFVKYFRIEKISESTNALKRQKIHPKYTLFQNSSMKLDMIVELQSYNIEILVLKAYQNVI